MRSAVCARSLATAAALTVLLSACAGTPAALRPEAARTTGMDGYLNEAAVAALADAVPPPPVLGSADDLDDKARSARFVALEDTDRWLLATAHAELRPPLALQHFDCALDARLDPVATPQLTRLMQRLFHDADSAAERVKARAHRSRPVGDDPQRNACQRLTEASRASASYPSGSSTVGAVYGETFAALDPARADAARRIGDELGRSRLVCAMHYPRDVAAGDALGRAVFQAAAAQPDFQADLIAARAELAAVQATGARNPGCAAEARALATPLP
ncbi:phosphatase PAP2 family protein [Brevundimonas guildfordensis]|uniref:Acid phosphatase n=1 Tax=Brevundimonas guildfordensis TaxID=2762241 RepID=A0ABR8R0S1_9CAUL|nr:PA-phosphatase [Brevundimonas guildfordensis]MBD7941378.1 PA-phosphatase [Brevundimonas guildfordensis]